MEKRILPVYDIEDFKYLGKESNFYANTLKRHLSLHPSVSLNAHKHNFYFSVICTRGSGVHEVEFKKYEVNPGKIFMIGPGQVHTWQLSKDTEGYIFFHTKAFYDFYFSSERVENYPFYCSHMNSPEISLKKQKLKKVEEMYEEIIYEYHHNALMKFQKISSLINVLYISLSREYIRESIEGNKNVNYLGKLKKLEVLIDKHFRTIKSPGEFAKMMHMSVKHLNRICKITLNKTLSEMISDRIILEAKRLMVYTNYNISEIINELGYDDHSYFSRLFKKKTNETPFAFINLNRSNSLSFISDHIEA